MHCRGAGNRALRFGFRWVWPLGVLALVGCSSTPSASQPTPTPGQITFYLGLPTHARSLVTDAVVAAMPGNPGYRRFSTLASLSSKYGASSATIGTVVGGIKKTGLTVAVDPSRLFARVTGTAGQWASALGAPLKTRSAPRGIPLRLYALPRELPAGLAPSGTTWLLSVTAVYDPRLDGHRPTSGLTRQLSGRTHSGAAVLPPGNMGTIGPTGCTQRAIAARWVYTPRQLQTAYGLTGLATAAGSAAPRIDVIDLGGGWHPNDLQAAGACFGYGSVHVSQSQGDGVPTPITNADGETSLDLQTVAAVAPKAAIHLIQTASPLGTAELDGFSRALADPAGLPDVVTLSYGGCAIADAQSQSALVSTTEELLGMIALSGTSTFIAAGDHGSNTCPQVGGIPKGFPTLSFPAVSRAVTAVGGTRLTLNAQNQRVREVVWNDLPYGESAAGGGGLGLHGVRPPYQDRFNPLPRRGVPDVSALAEIIPGWPVFLEGKLMPVGGTSGSTPFTAAATALVDAQQRSRGAPRVGLANGWFYRAAQRNPASFYDVTRGNNRLSALVRCCAATRGYDLASGLGVPNWSVLPSELPPPAP